ncbi:uncharacterized protein VNE69_07038 [Vairimorpha necatrix]|uniref:Uncharacterized protein n=1 Tax=Vairimorpha necatrix TaxID=6039 RepID=A0AAX4JDC3_9MICR
MKRDVILIARKSHCPQLYRVLSLLDDEFKIVYIDNDVVLNKYVKRVYNDQCPLIFSNNVYRGSGYEFILRADRRNVFKEWNKIRYK